MELVVGVAVADPEEEFGGQGTQHDVMLRQIG